MTSLISENIKSKVSSVLNKDTSHFGRKFLFDGDEETCWNSDQGSPQVIEIDFNGEGVVVEAVLFKFQGGFAGRRCQLQGRAGSEWVPLVHFHPKDISSEQVFSTTNSTSVARVRIIFEESYDLYGRITLYKLDLLGRKCSS